jgi:hypothetical protein
MLIEELIERAFSDGYEYALEEQREFARGSIRALKKQGKMNINMLSKFKKKHPTATLNNDELINSFVKKNGFGDYGTRSVRMEKGGWKLRKNNPNAADKMRETFENYAQKKGIDLHSF